jgi:hypothetical protein
MRSVHYLSLTSAVVAGLALLAGAGRRTAPEAAPSAPFTPPPAPVADAAACRTLEAAAAAVEGRRAGWLETTVRQRVRVPELEYEADGRYQSAPGSRFRLELRTRAGKTTGTVVAVSDGASVWRARRVGDGDWTGVRRIGLTQLLDHPGATPERRDELQRGPTFTGPAPLLRNLQKRMVWVKRAAVTRDGRAAVELTGVWPASSAQPDVASPPGMPDRCRLYLDADTLWPRRVEWCGPTAGGKTLGCLMEMELRDPVFDRRLTAEECARTFVFDPGNAAVTDETPRVSGTLTRKGR